MKATSAALPWGTMVQSNSIQSSKHSGRVRRTSPPAIRRCNAAAPPRSRKLLARFISRNDCSAFNRSIAPGRLPQASAAIPPACSAKALTRSIAVFIRPSLGGLLPANDPEPEGGSPPLNEVDCFSRAATTAGVTFKNSALCFADLREIVAATS